MAKIFSLFKHKDIYCPCSECLDILDEYKLHRSYIQILCNEIARLKENEKELRKSWNELYDELMEKND